MLKLLRNRKAQNTMEYALLIAIVVGVFSAMQLYVRRGMQARIRNGADNIPAMVLSQEADQDKIKDLFGDAEQYEPYYVAKGEYEMNTMSSEGKEAGAISDKGGVREVSGSTITRTGIQQVPGAEEE